MPAFANRRVIACLSLLLAAGCSAGPRPGDPASAPGNSAALVGEAQAFMESYARDLLAGERDLLVGRYDPRGAYMVGDGEKAFLPPDSIRAIYHGRWRPPASFEWRNLSYEPVGPDAVVVTGQFVWGVSAERQLPPYAYTALLVRHDGRFRIRVENESAASPPPPRCPPDSAARS
ncbi:MAG TPA: hypothetical protein VF746_30390 [Longimicrobium sp.]|jgi:hypothetical protein